MTIGVKAAGGSEADGLLSCESVACFLFDLPVSFIILNTELTLLANHLTRPTGILPVLRIASAGQDP